MLSRRTLVAAIPGIVAVGALAACAGQTSAQITEEVLTDATDVANGLASFISEAVGLSASTVSAITGYAQDAATAATSLVTSMVQTVAQPIVSQISADVSSVAAAVAGMVPAGSTAANILADVQLALPILMSAVGLVVTAAASPAQSAAMQRLHALPRVTLHH